MRRDDGGGRAEAPSNPESFRITSTDFGSYVVGSNADGAPVRTRASTAITASAKVEARKRIRASSGTSLNTCLRGGAE